MDYTVKDRLQHAWNAFLNRDPTMLNSQMMYNYRPDRVRLSPTNEKSIIASIYNQIALDVSSVKFQHARVDQNGRYLETIKSGLNEVLTLEANMDQSSLAFFQDVILSLFDEGCVALVPVETTINPTISGAFDIKSLRVGEILSWYPEHVRLKVYNEKSGRKEEITLPKKMVGIIENPLYAVMNEPNSTLKRLVAKLNLLDAIDNQSGSGKLDLILQLPYVVKSEERRKQADQRRIDIETQLTGSKYGIAWADGTEKITQLNRPVENNLMGQIQYLTAMLHSQLGMTQSIFDGTADEQTMLNYFNRTVKPILDVVALEMTRKFLTKTARSQNQTILYLRDSFMLVPVKELADIADKFTRNEILSSNEIRGIVGFKPSDDPRSDQLINKNIRVPEEKEGGSLDEQKE